MIAIGLPHGGDEDNLQREQDGGGEDIVEESINGIMRGLRERGPSGVRDLRAFASALEDLCSAWVDKDRHGVEEAASAAAEALDRIIQ